MFRSIWGTLKVDDIFNYLFAKSECLVQPGYRQLSLRVIVTLAEFQPLFRSCTVSRTSLHKKASQGFPLLDYCRWTAITENTWFLSVVYYESLISINLADSLTCSDELCWILSCENFRNSCGRNVNDFWVPAGVCMFPRSDKSAP